MRILHVGKFYPPVPGGIENFMGDLLPALGRSGHSVKALVHAVPGDLHGGTDNDRGVTVVRTPCHGNLLYAPVSPAFPMYLTRMVRNFRPQVLHLHVPNTSAFWALGLPACRDLPWVIHWHADVVASRLDRRLAAAYMFYRPLEQLLLHRSARIIVTSEAYLETSLPLRAWQSKCNVIPLGLDARRLKIPPHCDIGWAEQLWGAWPRRVLSIGRLTYYKGYEFLLQALQHLPDTRLLIVGEGERRPILQQHIDRLQLAERVGLTGYIEPEKLQALLVTSDVVGLPSLERTEAFGLVLLEAMRYGKPVVVTYIPGSGVGWVSGAPNCGILVPPADAGALAAALQALLNHPVRSKQMGAAGFRRFERLFQIEAVALQIAAVYRQVGLGPNRAKACCQEA